MPGTHQHKIFASPHGMRPERYLRTARRQTRMPGRHQRKIFASPHGAATPGTIYTQQGGELACQEHVDIQIAAGNRNFPSQFLPLKARIAAAACAGQTPSNRKSQLSLSFWRLRRGVAPAKLPATGNRNFPSVFATGGADRRRELRRPNPKQPEIAFSQFLTLEARIAAKGCPSPPGHQKSQLSPSF